MMCQFSADKFSSILCPVTLQAGDDACVALQIAVLEGAAEGFFADRRAVVLSLPNTANLQPSSASSSAAASSAALLRRRSSPSADTTSTPPGSAPSLRSRNPDAWLAARLW
mmetsp:Transcript_25119/g.63269  ORF Transcript_25119/g.63269 Transcript_25119/m.63269 type:complete len:111 (-) Transcript_25119:2326-2658(-)